MIRLVLLLFLVGGNLANVLEYPQLPGSYPIQAYAESASTMVTPSPTTSQHSTISTPWTTPPTPSPPAQCTGLFSCADCSTVQICRPSLNGFVPLETRPCSGLTPYCQFSSGTCTSVPDSTCGAKDSFICSDNGYFPDPTDCAAYHTCNSYMPKKFMCAEGMYYDPEDKVCSTTAQCTYPVNCTSENAVKMPMAKTHFFTYCSNGLPLMVSRCPGHYKLNSTSQVCEPICERDGLMADLEDCTRFYQCTTLYVSDEVSFPVRTNLPCPADEAFQPEAFQCIPKQSSTCKK